MGQGESTNPELMSESLDFFSMSLRRTSTLQIVNASKECARIFQGALSAEGLIHSERFKALAPRSTIGFKCAFMVILNRLYLETLDDHLSSPRIYVFTWIPARFSSNKVDSQRGRGNYICLAPSGPSSLDLIDFPSNLQNEVIHLLAASWGIHNESIQQKRSNCLRVQLSGSPWMSYGGSSTNATPIRRLFLNLRFIDAPEEISHAINRERMHNDALELQLRGRPWKSHFKESREDTLNVLEPWIFLGAQMTKSIFLFESQRSSAHFVYPNIRWTCFYFCSRGKLILVGPQMDVVAILNSHLSQVVEGPGVQEEGNTFIWKFKSWVFSRGDDTVRECFYTALIQVYNQMRTLGWELESSADVSSLRTKRNDDWESYDAHSWFFVNTIQ
ncbi:Uncharacterized protein FKW44_010815 [Caligus rogercresseyi]|uniref:Uncharacterized protein n=1 Tax=Caligus rogercresseyi TaxID=217165 RepID=A0A7T8HH47_CALRO|nr:Uncharacterized protein FKW44_010815 [Caligus rogercresseyi]